MKYNINDLKNISENIDIDEYIEFRESIKKNMENPEWLGDFSKEDLIFLLNNKSKIWMYYKDFEPVCSMMLIPSDEKSLNKAEINLDYQVVASYGPMMVNPDFVGNGLQYQMLKEIDEYSKEIGFEYAETTVHPDNIYSINNLIKDDFKLVNTKTYKRGIRNIYLKKL